MTDLTDEQIEDLAIAVFTASQGPSPMADKLGRIDGIIRAALAAQHPSQSDYETVLADHKRLVREMDVLLNGEAGAAQQASLVDLVAQVRRQGIRAVRPSQSAGEPVAIFSKGPWLFRETGQEFSGADLDAAAFAAYRDRLTSPPPTDAARASGVPVIKYGPLYEYAEGRGLDYNELCSLVRSVVSCRTMKDQTK